MTIAQSASLTCGRQRVGGVQKFGIFGGIGSGLAGKAIGSVLPHVDFSAVLFELDLVHQLIDQVDAASVVGVDILSVTGIRNGEGIEAGAGVTHHDLHAAGLIAPYTALNFLGGIVLAAMDNGVGQRFP